MTVTEHEPINIFFVEDNEVVRNALKFMLKKVSDFNVLGDAEDGRSAIEQLRQLTPCVGTGQADQEVPAQDASLDADSQ
jgi:DNA-binding NarL/FixJ family response regulator